MPESGKITATVDVFRYPEGSEHEGLVKVRAIVWTGPDFKTPTFTCGAIFEDEERARAAAARFVEAAETIGLPVTGSFIVAGEHLPALPVLPEKHAEAEYCRR